MAATSTVYLLHFDRPFGSDGHALHYRGSTADLAKRLAEHESGHGANLTKLVREAGIGWTLARTWEGGRQRERSLKNQGGASRQCPVCKGKAPQLVA